MRQPRMHPATVSLSCGRTTLWFLPPTALSRRADRDCLVAIPSATAFIGGAARRLAAARARKHAEAGAVAN